MTKQDSANLARFGCTLREDAGVFYIDWKGKRTSQASNVDVFACLGYVQTQSGRMVLLAFEISAVRPLPNYYYYPFDLSREGHRKYLSGFTENGEIRLRFLADKGTCERTHRLTPYLRSRASEVYAEALQEWKALEHDQYDFDSALQLMERDVRVPEFLDRLLLEDTLRYISDKINEAIQAVPNENRELARDIVREAAEAFLPYYQNNRKKFLENLYLARRGLTYVMDVHRLFADNPGGVTKFLSDALAASFSREELERLIKQVKLAVGFSKLPFKEQLSSATETTLTLPELPAGLVAVVQSMASSGISKAAASKFFELIGLEVGGRPGRHTKDYSREYELKKRLSWTDVARQSLQENAEIREEFGGRNFDSLSFEEQENLKNRIREGVRSYAERVGKPFPIETSRNTT